MSGKRQNFFIMHVEKIVLAVAGIFCGWVLISSVIISPNKVSYGGRKYDTGTIDEQINRQSQLLEAKINSLVGAKPPPEPCLPSFVSMLESSVRITNDVNLLQPFYAYERLSDDRKYSIPSVPAVADAMAEHYRAVAYVPLGDVDEQNLYEGSRCEPNDLDFVTVGAKFDAAELYRRFHECFAGDSVREEWRDPCLAQPVFGAVELQRQEMLADGTWSQWTTVPRARVEPRRQLFEIIEDVDKLPKGGTRVRLFQFDDWRVRMELLQPTPYSIASAEEEWFPPLLRGKYVEYQRQLEVEEKRKAAEAKKQEEERKESMRRDRGLTGDTGSYGDRGYYRDRDLRGEREIAPGELRGRERDFSPRGRRGPDLGRGPLGTRMDDERSRGEERALLGTTQALQKTPLDNIYAELDKLLVTDKTDLARSTEPLVFWAHDDTVVPGRSYQYRIRLGVFNPVAGTDQLAEKNNLLRDKAILWTKFAQVQKTIDVPDRLYFFPRLLSEAARKVSMRISRYVLGYWYSDNFSVSLGEVIGRVKDYKAPTETKTGVPPAVIAQQQALVPQQIDYSTGAVLLDVVQQKDWGGLDNYSDVLYSFDGTSIENIPVEMSHWPEELRSKFREIETAEKKPKKPWKAFVNRLDKGAWRRAEVGGTGTRPRDRGDRSREDAEREAQERYRE